MIEFKISIIDRLVTKTENGIEKPFLKIEIPMPLYNESDIQFFRPEKWIYEHGLPWLPIPVNCKFVFNCVLTSEDPIGGDNEAISQAFKEWYGSIWNDDIHKVTVFGC